jgi:predicted PurR-regulated permease PerM
LANGDHSAVFTRERVLTFVLALLTLLSVYLCYLIIEPFIPAIAFALALAVATQRPFNWLRRRFRNGTWAAAVAVLLVALLLIGPAVSLTAYIFQLAADNVNELRSGGGFNQLLATLRQIPFVGTALAQAAADFRIEEQIGNIGQGIATRASDFISGSIAVLTQLVITLFVLFFLYRDCGAALHSARTLMPLSYEESDRVFARIGSTIHATVNGSLTVALVQAVLAGIVYAILGVPAAVLWATVTFICALIPVFGTFLVWAPIALYLALNGSAGKAIFLVAWGGAVVGTIDNVLYPYLVGDKLRLHTVPTFFAILGGISVFGVAGLILGPLALAVAIALVDVWYRRTEHGQAAEEAVAPPGEKGDRPAAILQQTEADV